MDKVRKHDGQGQEKVWTWCNPKIMENNGQDRVIQWTRSGKIVDLVNPRSGKIVE